jgi:hypothetical protein
MLLRWESSGRTKELQQACDSYRTLDKHVEKPLNVKCCRIELFRFESIVD